MSPASTMTGDFQRAAVVDYRAGPGQAPCADTSHDTRINPVCPRVAERELQRLFRVGGCNRDPVLHDARPPSRVRP